MENINLLIQYSQINISKINTKKATQHHIVINMLKTNDKENNLKNSLPTLPLRDDL